MTFRQMSTPRYAASPTYPKVARPNVAARPAANRRDSQPMPEPAPLAGPAPDGPAPACAARLAYHTQVRAQAAKMTGPGTARAKPSAPRYTYCADASSTGTSQSNLPSCG